MFIHLGLIGYPLGHSLSPRIHQAALDSCGLEGNYSLFPIYPEDGQGLKDLLARVRSGEIAGVNVTIPHKQAVIPLLDELTQTAKAIGAVNTISMENGKLKGDNTDALGFLADVEKFLTTETQRHGGTPAPRPDRRRRDGRPEVLGLAKLALIFGAGGSARAVVYPLIYNGWNIVIVARRIEQAQKLRNQFKNQNLQLSTLEYRTTNLQSLIPDLSLIVNTTPLGMAPDSGSSPWPESLSFPPNAAVYDLVYNPRETKLVKDARAAGLPATTGLGMLVEQAALSFEIWTGQTPPREVLWNAVENRSPLTDQ